MTHRYRFATWTLKPDLGEIENQFQVQHLEPKLIKLLVCFLESEGRVLSRAELLDVGWQNTFVSDEALTTAISKLRRILGDTSRKPSFIKTIPKKGYQFIETVHHIVQESPRPQPKWHMEKVQATPQADIPIWPMAIITALALCLSLFWWNGAFAINELQMNSALPQPMTSLPGRETDAAISPDGRYLAFAWDQDGHTQVNLFLKDLRTEAIHQLTKNSGIDYSPAWRPDGKRLAFIRKNKASASLFLLDIENNREDKLYDLFASRSEGLSWSPDGQFLAFSDHPDRPDKPGILIVKMASGEVTPVSQPPKKSMGDYLPRFSPTGDQIAFIRRESAGINHVFITDLSGNSSKIAGLNGVLRGVEWLSDQKLLFASDHSGPSALMYVDIYEKDPIPFPGMAYNAASPTLSPGGNYLTFETIHDNANIVSFDLKNPAWQDKTPLRTLIASTRWDSTPQYSPNGKQMVFSSARNGRSQIWVCDADGRNLTQLTHMVSGFTSAPRWSPDGKTIAFDTRPLQTNKVQIFTVPATGGEPYQISDGMSNDLLPTWSHNGEFIYFQATRDNQRGLWRMPAMGGTPVLMTAQCTMLGLEDPDGKGLFFVNSSDDNRLWRKDLVTGKEKRYMDQVIEYWGNWAVNPDGIYFLKHKEDSKAILRFKAWAKTQPKSLRSLPFIPENLGFAIHPNGTSVAVTKRQAPEGDIMLLPLH